MYDSGGVNGCDTVGNGALHYVLQLMGRVWCYGERLRARYHNHLATLYHDREDARLLSLLLLWISQDPFRSFLAL